MKRFNLSNYNAQTKVFLVAVFGLSLVFCGLTVYEAAAFPASQIAAIFIALAVSALTNQYRLIVPKTRIKIKVQEFIIFWAIVWLGAPAGVLIAAADAVAGLLSSAGNEQKRRVIRLPINIIAAFIAGNVFNFIAGNLTGFSENSSAAALNFQWLALGVFTVVSIYYILSTALDSLFLQIEATVSASQIWRKNFASAAVNCLFAVCAAFVFHFAFRQFGLSFGLVILPLAFISQMAYQIHVARFAQKTKEISEASRVHLATVEALATAIDARDQVGIGHVRRTQIYAVGVGKILDLSDGELQALNTGALLHDIGKLAVPDHILNKPGRLTAAEMEKTKIHAAVGAAILEKINFSYPVIPTVKYHHEMWDGGGYPEGLKREEIPLTARILSIADAYDTLRGARPYRAAVSRDDARKFLLNGAGAQFDPKLVDLFLRNLRQFEAEIVEQGFSYNFDSESALQNFFDDNDEENYVEQIKRANREVFTLYELARVFSSSLNLADTLSLFVKKIGEFVPFDSCAVYLLEENGENARAAYAFGKHDRALTGKIIRTGEGATGFVLKKRQAVHNIDPGIDFTFDQTELAEEYAGMISLPLLAEEKLIGAVSLYSCEIEVYEEEYLRLLETISRIAADAISTALQHAETESKALTDTMTALPNARSLQMRFENEAARASRNDTNFHLLMLDLDGFKAVNDTFGHKAGDRLLREISKVMQGQLREYDFLARYAGDEFVIIVPETGGNDIQDLCGRIERAVYGFALPIDEEGTVARVGVSLGAARYPQQGVTLDEIIVAADKAMYRVKGERKAKDRQKSAEQKNLPPAANNTQAQENYIVELDESHIISSTAIN